MFRMQMSRYLLSFFIALGLCNLAFGQKHLVDSLNKLLDTHPNEDSIRVSILVQLATTEMYDHPAVAGNYASQARTISEKIQYGEGMALAYRLLGNSFWSQANQSAALYNFLKGMKIADSIHDEQIQADLLGNLGMVYNDMNDYPSALRYYKASLVKQVNLKNKLREAVMRLNVGNGYYRLKKYDSSLYFYNQSMAILNQLKNTRTIIDLLNIGMGDVYADMGKHDEALQYYYKGQKSSDTTHHHRTMVHSRVSIARVFIARHQYSAADKELIECLRLAKEVGMKTYIRDCLELLSQSAIAQGNTAAAFDYFRLFTAYKDSIQNTAEQSRIASLQLEYEMQKKSLEINVLKKDSEIQEEEIKFKSTLLTTSAIVLALITLFLIYLYRNFRIQKSISIALADSNAQIIKQRTELEKQRDEAIALNAKIRSQQNESIFQRDSLIKKNKDIESLHKEAQETNQNLEIMVAKRATALQEQHKRLEEYAYINAFKLRGPVANINGIVELMQKGVSTEEEKKMVEYLKKSSTDLDLVIRSISDTLHYGITAYEKHTK